MFYFGQVFSKYIGHHMVYWAILQSYLLLFDDLSEMMKAYVDVLGSIVKDWV